MNLGIQRNINTSNAFLQERKNLWCWCKNYVSLCKQKTPLISILWELYSKEKDKAHVVYCWHFTVKWFYRFWKNELFIEVYIFFHWADIQFLENILPSLNLINPICYVYSLTKKMNPASLNSQHFSIFLSTRKSKSCLYQSSPCNCSIVCARFPIPSNKSIDLLTSWQWSSSNSALALNTNKKFSISSPKRPFNQVSPFPWAKSAPQNSI